MNDIIPARRASARAASWLAGITATFLVAGAGVSAAAVRYDARNAEIVVRGTSIGGVDLGGLTFADARKRLTDEFESPLERPITIEANGETFLTSPRHLGATTDALNTFELVTSQVGGASLPQRVVNRLEGRLANDHKVRLGLDPSALEAFIASVAAKVEGPASDAQISFTGGALQITEGKVGFQMDRPAATAAIRSAVESGAVKATLPGSASPPVLRKTDISDVIVVKVGENKLLHYRGTDLVKEYGVATGLPRYPTPKGNFKIVNKRYRPTWVNPAKYPGGWGASLPAKIGPGRGNPLGTRAMDLNSPGIRIHGTSANYSIGYNASHGCIRMRMADVEELFDRVGVGTPVLIVQTAPNRPIGRRATGVESLADADGTSIPGQPPPPPAYAPPGEPAPPGPGA